MADHSHEFPILKMSQVFNVSVSGYYRWLNRPASKRALENARLCKAIRKFWGDSKHVYGAPRIHQDLLGDKWTVSRPRVARLMRRMGISSQLRKKWVKTTDSNHTDRVAPNVLDRQFDPTGLNQVWVSDITYLPSRKGWLYLSTVMDLADRQILGWSLSTTLRAEHTSIASFARAHAKRPACDGMIFHSDRGSQYACTDFVELLNEHDITQSMSRKGNCWDNAPAESFFKTLKAELVSRIVIFRDSAHARAALFDYIEVWYNRKRAHSTLGYKTPIQAEAELKLKLQRVA